MIFNGLVFLFHNNFIFNLTTLIWIYFKIGFLLCRILRVSILYLSCYFLCRDLVLILIIWYSLRRACGGEWGTNKLIDPSGGHYSNTVNPPFKPGKVNVTAPDTITGRGGTVLMDINYICYGDFCGKSSAFSYRKSSGFLGACSSLLVSFILITFFI